MTSDVRDHSPLLPPMSFITQLKGHIGNEKNRGLERKGGKEEEEGDTVSFSWGGLKSSRLISKAN